MPPLVQRGVHGAVRPSDDPEKFTFQYPSNPTSVLITADWPFRLTQMDQTSSLWPINAK